VDRIDQRLHPHTTYADPGVKRRVRDGQPRAPEVRCCRYEGRWPSYLATNTCASSPAAGMPLPTT